MNLSNKRAFYKTDSKLWERNIASIPKDSAYTGMEPAVLDEQTDHPDSVETHICVSSVH